MKSRISTGSTLTLDLSPVLCPICPSGAAAAKSDIPHRDRKDHKELTPGPISW
jgi:hypothetical protein